MKSTILTHKQRIQKLAATIGLSVRGIAQAAGVSEATLYHVTDNSRKLSERTAARICYNLEKQYGVVVNKTWLLTGEGEMINGALSVAVPVDGELKPVVAAEGGEYGSDWRAKYYDLLEQHMALQKKYLELIESQS